MKILSRHALCEGLGAPSQKTSLPGGVVQIFIYPRLSPCLADEGLFVRPTNLPRTKSLPTSSTFFTMEDQTLDRDPTLQCVGQTRLT